MPSTKFIAAGVLVLLTVFVVSMAQDNLNRPTRPEKFASPEDVHAYIRKFKEYLDKNANPR